MESETFIYEIKSPEFSTKAEMEEWMSNLTGFPENTCQSLNKINKGFSITKGKTYSCTISVHKNLCK